MQPWRAFKPDGVILFSDILTPLAGMGIDFDIVVGKGPIIADPIRSLEVRPPDAGTSSSAVVPICLHSSTTHMNVPTRIADPDKATCNTWRS